MEYFKKNKTINFIHLLVKINRFFFIHLKAMWLMLQAETPEDFVISTNEAHSVREFVEAAFREINREIM
jgi:hypothetical protein